MRNMKKWMAVLLGLLTLASAAGLAETVSLANELTYVESVEYKGNGIFEIEFMRNVAWRDDFVLTGTDEAGGPLVVSSLGGDAGEFGATTGRPRSRGSRRTSTLAKKASMSTCRKWHPVSSAAS